MSTTGRRRVLFVGLGKMGEHLAGHVHRHLPDGWTMAVNDVDRSRAASLAQRWGLAEEPDLAAAVSPRDVLCLSVPDGTVVRSVLDGLTAAHRIADVTVLDFSSVAPSEAVDFANLCAGAGGRYHDCPVTGGVVGAEAGNLTMMVGGSDELPADVEWLLHAFTAHVVRAGAHGNGALMKTLSNLVGNVAAMVTMEAIVLAKRSGVTDEVLLDVLNNGPGRTYYSSVRYPRYVQTGAFNAGMRLALVVKDLRIALDHAARVGADPGVCRAGAAQWERAMEQLGFDADTTRSIESVAQDVCGVSWTDLISGKTHSTGPE